MMWDYGYGGIGSWIGMAFMMFFGLLVLVGIVLLIVWLARSGGYGGGRYMGMGGGTSGACDIAKQRYARGEISKEEFEEICRTVGG